MKHPSVGLVSMPFHGCTSPSMALGLLKAILTSTRIAAKVHNFNLDFIELAVADPALATERELEFEHVPLPAAGEWVFRPAESAEQEAQSARELARTLQPDQDIAYMVALRRKVGPFLDRCVAKLLEERHDILCFQASYMQTQAALRIAELVRRQAPSTRIVVGGASVYRTKGRALIQAFPVVDVVCHGEGDLLIEPIVRALRGEPGYSLQTLRGLSFRGPHGVTLGDDDGPQITLDELPPPDHTEYVTQTTAMIAAGELNPRARLSLTFESARGCWWAVKRQCSFCSLDQPAFRSKSPERVLSELDSLAERHATCSFYCVDLNLEPGYFDTVLPALAKRDYRFLWNIKPNMSRRQFEQLARAGVLSVLVGIESLVTPTLRLMNKGSTAIRNIQALKWCCEFGILPLWNYLSHVPGERLQWLQELAKLLPRIMHLTPPYVSRIAVERDSPYYRDSARHGVRIDGPELQGRLAFAAVAPELVEQLTHAFEYTIVDRDPRVDAFFADTIWPLLMEWIERVESSGCTLSIVHGPTESLVVHGPLWKPVRLVRVGEAVRGLLLACEGVQKERALPALLQQVKAEAPVSTEVYRLLRATLARGLQPTDVLRDSSTTGAIAQADAADLIVREGDQLLALPVDRTAYVRTASCQKQLAMRRLRDCYVAGGEAS